MWLVRVMCVFSGDTPSEVELMYLENAQMLAQYGIHMYPAKVSHTYTLYTADRNDIMMMMSG